MTRRYPFLLLVLAAIWGSSYLFIKIAGRELSPAAMMELRLLLALPILLGFLAARDGAAGAAASLRRSWRPGLVLGTTNAAIPFTLIAWGERHVDSGVAAVGNSSVPIFVALLAIPLLPSERFTGWRLAGVLGGLAGVAVLVGVHPRGGWWAVVGTLAVIGSSISYAWSNLYAHRKVGDTAGPVLAAASMLGGAIVLLPFALADLPGDVPGWGALGSVAFLAVAGTGIAQLLLYRTLRLHGGGRTSLVAYLLPVFALFYGAVFLEEPLTAPKLGGLALILAGVAVGAGAVRLTRRTPLTQAP